jgi:membrane associated rhomboid family serine protease
MLSPSSVVPMVGASGAISGVMGAYLILYPRVRVYTLLLLGFFITTIALPAWVMLAYWMLLQLVGGFQSIVGGNGGVAFWAHVGGFVAGCILIKLFARRDYVEAHSGSWRPRRIGWNRSPDDDY